MVDDQTGNDVITESCKRGNSTLPSENSDSGEDDGSLMVGRREYLSALGMATAAVAGCTGGLDQTVEVNPVSIFGYGGAQFVNQSSSLSVSVTESEPNDDKQNAMQIDYGSTVSGSLTQSDGDWYAIEISTGDSIVVEFNRSASTGVSAIILYGTTGSLQNIRYATTSQPVVFTETADAAGTYFVQVVDTQNSASDYTLSVGSGADSTPTPTATATPTPTATPDDDYGIQGYGEYGYGGVSN